ncbi:MAG: FHA domain-containing protein [candidate division NC10 bacterium]|nr:FHA domain-containing protein [candidate division NC10 bacterium]
MPARPKKPKDRTDPLTRPKVRAAAARLRASVVIVEGPGAGQEYPLEKAVSVLGREKGADILLPDTAVSRRHAALDAEGAAFRLRDLGSTNGTLLNGKKIRESAVRHGDRFQVGNTTLQFVVEEREGGGPVYEVG